MAHAPLIEVAERALRAAALSSSLVGATVARNDLGDGEAVFLVGSLLVRFVRDRGQDFLDVAPEVRPKHFHLADDVEIAFGWKTVDEVLAKREPEPLNHVLARLASRMTEIAEAFAEDRVDFTLQEVKAAAKRRGDTFAARLR
jgi:hypothetical protein